MPRVTGRPPEGVAKSGDADGGGVARCGFRNADHKVTELAPEGDGVALRFCLGRVLAPRRFAPVDLELPPLDTQKDLSLALAAIGRAAAEGDITSEQALHLARLIDVARRAIEARDAECRESHFWGRERSPAAPRPVSGEPAGGRAQPDGRGTARSETVKAPPISRGPA